jgi:hypothetical protein
MYLINVNNGNGTWENCIYLSWYLRCRNRLDSGSSSTKQHFRGTNTTYTDATIGFATVLETRKSYLYWYLRRRYILTPSLKRRYKLTLVLHEKRKIRGFFQNIGSGAWRTRVSCTVITYNGIDTVCSSQVLLSQFCTGAWCRPDGLK